MKKSILIANKFTIVILSLIIISLFTHHIIKSSTTIFSKERINYYTNTNIIFTTMENYASANSNNIYVYDSILSLNFSTQNNNYQKPVYNLFMWGGTNVYSHTYYEQLALLNIKNFNSDSFFDENVFYISRFEANNSFIEYLKKRYGTFDILLVEKLDYNIMVYKFVK